MDCVALAANQTDCIFLRLDLLNSDINFRDYKSLLLRVDDFFNCNDIKVNGELGNFLREHRNETFFKTVFKINDILKIIFNSFFFKSPMWRYFFV